MQLLEEPYPTLCHNNGQLSQISQVYFMCRDANLKGKLNRVTKENYLHLKQLPEYKCTDKNVTKSVCVCPKNYGDF